MNRKGPCGLLITDTETHGLGPWEETTVVVYENDQCVQPGSQVALFRQSTVEAEMLYEIDLQTAFNLTPDRSIRLILNHEDGSITENSAIFCGGTAENDRVLSMCFRFQS